MNLTRSASQVSTTSELLQRNSGARWAPPKDDDPPSPPAKPPPLTKGKSTKIKRRGADAAEGSLWEHASAVDLGGAEGGDGRLEAVPRRLV